MEKKSDGRVFTMSHGRVDVLLGCVADKRGIVFPWR